MLDDDEDHARRHELPRDDAQVLRADRDDLRVGAEEAHHRRGAEVARDGPDRHHADRHRDRR